MTNEFKKPTFECCHYKNGKLYMFTKDKITVIKMTPSGPAAWCKSAAKPCFTPCHLPDFITGVAFEKNDVPMKDNSLKKPESSESKKYYQFQIKAQVDFFKDKFDPVLLDKARDYTFHPLDMYKLLMFPGAAELVESNPSIAYMVALNRIFCPKKVAKPWRRAKSMLKMKRRKILAMCGFPESESLVHIFSRMGQESVKNILFIRKALERNPELLRTLSFVESFKGNVISFATLPRLSSAITAQFLNEAAQTSESIKQFEQLCLVRDTARMSAVLGETLGRLKSIKDFKRKHDELIVPYTAKMKLVMVNASFPEPPFDGASTPDFEIYPVTTPEMLHKWAVSQHNCVMTSFGSIVMARSAIYMITRPVEATLEVMRVKTGDEWRLGQFKGTCNTDVPDIVIENMRKWFDERKDSPRHVEVPKSVANFTDSEYYAHIASYGLPVPVQPEHDPNVGAALKCNELEVDTEFAAGPMPECVEPDFMVKSVHRADEMAEVLRANPYLPKPYLESARAGEVFVYIAGINDKRLVFLSAENFPERKIEIECVYPHSERVLARLRDWITNYVSHNGFPLPFEDENQMEFELIETSSPL
jgi:hypothetical protein